MNNLAGNLIGAAIFAALSFLTWLGWRRLGGRKSRGSEEEFEKEYAARQEAAMHCPKCGYDLRATPDRCPECGTANVDRREYLRHLREDWPAHPIDPRVPALGELPELLVGTEIWDEADLLRQQLLARGIACYGRKSRMAWQDPPGGYGSELYEIMVYAADLEAARAYLNHSQSPARSQTLAEK